DVGAVLHVHSRFATALACLNKAIPAFHYMVAVAGGESIRCADYATFGSQALSNAAIAALKDRKACLLAHHGMIALGSAPELALRLAIEVEALAATYVAALQAGAPRALPAREMTKVLALFRTYGTAEFPQDGLQRIRAR
ncbi:MAG: class II aldolase/adducin family protein, partial [Beijerinckiaceae bacterium]